FEVHGVPPGVVLPGKTRKDGLQSEGLKPDDRLTRGSGDHHVTPNQMHELLDTDQARSLVEGAEERGFIEAADFEAFTLEHDLTEVEIEEITREFERIGLEVGRPPAAEPEKEKPEPVAVEAAELSGSADSLQLFLADVGRHKLLNAAEEVTLAK